MDLRNAFDARTFTTAVLEDYAAEVFAPVVIAIRIQRAMRFGFLSTQIAQDRALDLSRTAAATALVKALDTLGYDTDWTEVKRIEPASRGEVPREYMHPELVIMWHQRLLESRTGWHCQQ